MEYPTIYLRNWQVNDAPVLYNICLDTEIRASGFSFYDNIAQSLDTINIWKKSPNEKAVIETSSNEVIGIISLGDMNRYHGYYEMEYAISAHKRNKGYAKQAVSKIIEYGFTELQAEVIAAWVRSHNQTSTHVLEKCGFSFEGRLRKHARDKSDTLCYSITKEDWQKQK